MISATGGGPPPEQRRAAGHAIPSAVTRVVTSLGAADRMMHPVWHNELGGLTFRLEAGNGMPEQFIKWNPLGNGIDLERETLRLTWFRDRLPVPRIVDSGADETSEWIVTEALPGDSAVAERWRAQPERSVRAIAEGLRAMHALDPASVPVAWASDSWALRMPPALGPRPEPQRLAVVHGDSCPPNTLLDDDGRWCGTVDLGDAAVADPWADLAVASMSLDWNYGPGWQGLFWEAYGIEPDPARIAYYRALWDLES